MRRGLFATLLLVAVVACTGGPDGAVADDGGDEGAVVGDALSLELPEPGPVNPFVTVADDGIWLVGGVAGMAGAWGPSNFAVLYDPNGAPVRSTSLPVPDGRFLAGGTVVGDADGTTIAATTCALPATYSACTGPQEPILVRVEPDGVTDLALTGPITDLADGGEDEVSLGRGPDGTVLVSAAAAHRVGDAAPRSVRGWTVDRTGASEEVTLPPGVMGAGAVCSSGDTVFAAVAAAGQVDLVAVDPGETSSVATLDVGSTVPTAARLTCLADAVVVAVGGDPGWLAVADTASGRWVGEPVEDAGADVQVVTDGASTVAAITARRVAVARGPATEQVVHYRASRADGVTRFGAVTDDAGRAHLAIPAGSGLVDVAPLIADPRGGEPQVIVPD